MGKGELSKPVKSHSGNKHRSALEKAKKVAKKNISKKDADKMNRFKKHQKIEKIKERKA